MDPLSATVAATQVAELLYKASMLIRRFVKDAKAIDANLKGLGNEIQSLMSIVNSITTAFEDPTVQPSLQAAKDNAIFLNHVIALLTDCKISGTEVLLILESLSGRDDPDNFLWKSARQIRFYRKHESLDRLQARLSSHKSDLQVALGVINMLVTGHSSDRVNNSLGSKIDQLAKNLEMQLMQRKSVNGNGVGEDDDDEDARFIRHSKELIDSATKVLSRQNTLILEDIEVIDMARELDIEREEHESEFEEVEDQGFVPPSNRSLHQTQVPLPARTPSRKQSPKSVDTSVLSENGCISASDHGMTHEMGQNTQIAVRFSTPFTNPPRMIYGLSHIDCVDGENVVDAAGPRVAFDVVDIAADGFQATARTFGNCVPWDLKMSWLTLPENGIHFETGTFDTSTVRNDSRSLAVTAVTFSRPFQRNPIVCCWFTEVDIPYGWRSLRTWAARITHDGFVLSVDTWADRVWKNARVNWLAYDAEEDGRRIKSSVQIVKRHEVRNFSSPWLRDPQARDPTTFIAITELDCGPSRNTRISGQITNITGGRLIGEIGTWDDTDMDHLHCTWISIE
ncbi:hypothetical protein LTR84_002282 [Exophiala bonariae]|uniref:H-type lectin domain-containing protein n=1 Tax=Exophiala bonariae TaxID=1690606 RepID=A0AAV9NAV0_9EURO|nr:hypothetical protein LTR84_002282 [Exophiala bonariae]